MEHGQLVRRLLEFKLQIVLGGQALHAAATRETKADRAFPAPAARHICRNPSKRFSSSVPPASNFGVVNGSGSFFIPPEFRPQPGVVD
jgi:hypothetical protein